MKSHSLSFFGQKVGIILSTASWHDDYVFLSFLKKKPDGTWEKPSKKEGKTIKFNLNEMILILCVFEGKKKEFKTFHKFQKEETPIGIIATDPENIKISIPGYSKPLRDPETESFKRLLSHILEEKFIYATAYNPDEKYDAIIEKTRNFSHPKPTFHNDNASSSSKENEDISVDEILNSDYSSSSISANPTSTNSFLPSPSSPQCKTNIENVININRKNLDPVDWAMNLENDGEYALLPGEITSRRGKAISFQINGLSEIWLPVSQLKDPEFSDQIGGVWVREWLIKKKLDDIFSEQALV